MKKKKLIYFVLVVLVLFPFNIGWTAQTANPSAVQSNSDSKAKSAGEFEVYSLGEIVISAENAKVKEVAIVNEITAEDIKASNSKTLAEALFYAPGIRVTNGSKNESNVYIHGFSQNQLLVLIDGVPYYETKYGKLDLNQIPTENIAKIEITKGAASVIYGPNALGGVINVITKKPSDKPYASGSFEVSNNDTYRASATHGMKAGIFNYWLNYTWAKSGGYDLSNGFVPRLTTIRRQPGGTSYAILQDKGERVNSDYESHNVWVKFGIEPNKNSEYYLNLHYLNRDKGWSPSTDFMRVFNSRPYFTNFAEIPNYLDWGADLDARQKINDKLTLKAKLFYHNHNDDLVSYDQSYTTKLATSTYKDYIIGGALFADFKPVDWDVLRFSVHYKRDNHQQRDDEYLPFEESVSSTGSVGVENEFNMIKNLSVVAGISYDWYRVDKAEKSYLTSSGDFNYIAENPTNDSDVINPMIGLTYTFSDATKIFGSVAHKSRFPTLNELYGKQFNPDLKAETSWNYTLGVSRPIFTFARAGLSVFYYDVSDMISKDGPQFLGTNYNVGKVELFGVDVNAEIYPLDGLTLRVDYTYENARNKSEGRVTDNVTYIPAHKVDVDIRYVIPVVKTRLNFDITYVSSAYSQLPTPSSPTNAELIADDYTIFDAKITQPVGKYFEVYVACKNIFDKNYEPEVGYPAPGRSFWSGIQLKF